MAQKCFLLLVRFETETATRRTEHNQCGLTFAESKEEAKEKYIGRIVSDNKGEVKFTKVQIEGVSREILAQKLDLVPREDCETPSDLAARKACTAEMADALNAFMKFIDGIYAPELEAKAKAALDSYRRLIA